MTRLIQYSVYLLDLLLGSDVRLYPLPGDGGQRQLVNDKGVGDGHDKDGQEVLHDRDKGVVDQMVAQTY